MSRVSRQNKDREIKESENLTLLDEINGVKFYFAEDSELGAREFAEQAWPKLFERIQFWAGMLPNFTSSGIDLGVLMDESDYLEFSFNAQSVPYGPMPEGGNLSKISKLAKCEGQRSVLLSYFDGLQEDFWHPGIGFGVYGNLTTLVDKSQLKGTVERSIHPGDIDVFLRAYCEKKIQVWERLNREVVSYFGAISELDEETGNVND